MFNNSLIPGYHSLQSLTGVGTFVIEELHFIDIEHQHLTQCIIRDTTLYATKTLEYYLDLRT